MKRNNVKYYLGSEEIKVAPLGIFSPVVMRFLDELSRGLRKDREAARYPDIMTFAFWCRKSNIEKLKNNYANNTEKRVGRGLVFHIAPSNVPINFAFSFVFGLLAGNGNIVRVSTKDFEQTKIVCRIISEILEKNEYSIIKQQNEIVKYEHDKEITDEFSAMCDVRVIWGGDYTINEIRKSPIKSRCTEITFADRYSFAIFDETTIEKLTEGEMNTLAQGFYNDTYLMDQNACSSPHLIFWKQSETRTGRDRFYKQLFEVAQKYDLEEKKVIDKFTMLNEMIAKGLEVEDVEYYGNMLYVVRLATLSADISLYRGKFGLFFESDILDYSAIVGMLNSKIQTCVIYGIDNSEFVNFLMENHALGIDRIVKPGEAMDIGIYWDGYDVIGNMSRMIVCD